MILKHTLTPEEAEACLKVVTKEQYEYCLKNLSPVEGSDEICRKQIISCYDNNRKVHPYCFRKVSEWMKCK